MNTLHPHIDLLDELLDQDPGSTIFFPLAKLYRKHGNATKALDVVRKGITKHPQFLEAQLFLIDVLHEHGRHEEAEEAASAIFKQLQSSSAFWQSLRIFFTKKKKNDAAFAAFLLGQTAQHLSVDFFSLLHDGVEKYAQQTLHSHSDRTEPEFDLDADEVTQICINSGIRTKTMAKLLAAQGEIAQAINIYDELLATSQNPHEQRELEELRNQLQPKKSLPEKSAQKKVCHLLNKLASRLESKYA